MTELPRGLAQLDQIETGTPKKQHQPEGQDRRSASEERAASSLREQGRSGSDELSAMMTGTPRVAYGRPRESSLELDDVSHKHWL